MHALAGAYERLRRANEHLRDLREQIETFVRTDAHGMTMKGDRATREFIITFSTRKRPPLKWSVIVGEILFNLRSSLDHLAWQVASLYGKPHEQVIFPVYEKPNDFKRYVAEKLPPLIPPEVIADFRRFQPPNGWKGPNGGIHTLWFLNKLSNIDKHRMLHLPQFFMKKTSYTLKPGSIPVAKELEILQRGPLEDGAVLLWLRFAQPGPMQVKFNFSLDVTFDQVAAGIDRRIPAGHAIGETLEHFLRHVAADIFPRFMPLFPMRPTHRDATD